jgi:acetylglutamate kinase
MHLSVSRVTKIYEPVTVLHDVSLVASDAERVGFVGEIDRVDVDVLNHIAADYIPVIASVGADTDGNSYNVNADAAAAALAVELGVEHLFLLTDVDGLLKDGSTVESLAPEECEGYVASGLAAGGMVPKLRAAAEAARGGIGARIMNGNKEGVLAAAIAGEKVGTLVSEGVVA